MNAQDLRSGDFNRRIIIEQQSESTDTYGQPVPGDWNEVITCWAQVLPFVGQISGFSIKPAPDTAVAPVTINVRYWSARNVTKGMRARNLTTGELYRILHVADVETANRYIQLACQVAT